MCSIKGIILSILVFVSLSCADSPLLINVELTNVQCNGDSTGSASIKASGGHQEDNGEYSYSYSWSPNNDTIGPEAPNLTAGEYTVMVTSGNQSETLVFDITQPLMLRVSGTTFNPLCHGGTGAAQTKVMGGTPPFSYHWLPYGNPNGGTTTGLYASSYFVTVTDSCGASGFHIFNIVEPVVPTTVDVKCNGDSTGYASVYVMGGTPPYFYAWSSGSTASSAQSLPAGIHNVTVTDALGCSSTQSLVIQEPDPILITPAHQDVLCSGDTTGAANITVSGGTGRYMYFWDPLVSASSSASQLTDSTYVATVIDSNWCTKSHSFSIGAIDDFVVIGTGSPSCHNKPTGFAIINVTGGLSNQYTYRWSNGANASNIEGVPPGEYSVVVSDAWCKQQIVVTVTESILDCHFGGFCENGWTGYPDCNQPICLTNVCVNGNCTNPEVCTCDEGWSGNDCSTPERTKVTEAPTDPPEPSPSPSPPPLPSPSPTPTPSPSPAAIDSDISSNSIEIRLGLGLGIGLGFPVLIGILYPQLRSITFLFLILFILYLVYGKDRKQEEPVLTDDSI